MSFGFQQQQSSAMALMQAEFEMDTMMEIYNTMLHTCHQKCISPKYNDSELNKGEGVCTDRCVAKFMTITQLVGKKMQQQQQQPAQ